MRTKSSLFAIGVFAGVAVIGASCGHSVSTPSFGLDPRFRLGAEIYSDAFLEDNGHWVVELEKGGRVVIAGGKMEIDVSGGCTVWFRPELSGPVLIEYDATVLQAGGANDRVSDLNCFWMAQDSRSPNDIFATHRTGQFADYDQLRCYYAGQGGNTNTTTRFRRYIGIADNRPLLPKNDLRDAQFLLSPNVKQHITLVACGSLIQYYRDGRKIFELNDPAPYTCGWFALRTTWNHLVVENFCVRTLLQLK